MKAATGLAAERERRGGGDQRLAAFLALTGLDADLPKAAADLTAERGQHAEAERRLAAFLRSTGLAADLEKAAADLAAERELRALRDHKLARFLESTGLDADLVEAAVDLGMERERHAAADEKLGEFLAAAGLDTDLVKAAADLAAEREQHAVAERKAAAEVASLSFMLREADTSAKTKRHELLASIDAANIKIEALESTSRQAALDKEAASGDARRFWTAAQSIRVLMSPVVPSNSNSSCILPKKDGSAKVRLRFLVINVSPYEVRVTNIKFSFSATMDAFQVSGEYNGPQGVTP